MGCDDAVPGEDIAGSRDIEGTAGGSEVAGFGVRFDKGAGDGESGFRSELECLSMEGSRVAALAVGGGSGAEDKGEDIAVGGDCSGTHRAVGRKAATMEGGTGEDGEDGGPCEDGGGGDDGEEAECGREVASVGIELEELRGDGWICGKATGCEVLVDLSNLREGFGGVEKGSEGGGGQNRRLPLHRGGRETGVRAMTREGPTSVMVYNTGLG